VFREADNFVDYQERAQEFAVGDVVVPYGFFESQSGRVIKVWPAIGMADVEFAGRNLRWPVEDLQKFVDGTAVPSNNNSVAGGPTVGVSGGSKTAVHDSNKASSSRVATAYLKQALYWASQDRQYKMTRAESGSGKPCCPKCAEAPPLRKAVYKRRDGTSNRLLGCPTCLFLIKDTDIVNHPAAVAMQEGAA